MKLSPTTTSAMISFWLISLTIGFITTGCNNEDANNAPKPTPPAVAGPATVIAVADAPEGGSVPFATWSYRGHWYVVYGGESVTMVHDPDCPCGWMLKR